MLRITNKPLLLFISMTLLLISCNTPKQLEYREFKNFTIDKPGFSSTALKMDLIYFNPNNFGLELNHTDLDIFINNNYLGKATQVVQVNIPRNAEFVIPIMMNVDMKNLLKNSLISMMSSEVLVKVTGTIRVGKLNVFKSFPINYEGKQQFSLF